jgi:hypothetical protein
MAIDTKLQIPSQRPNGQPRNGQTRNRLRRPPDPPIPHPSWYPTITGVDQDAGRIVNAGDFWARLGI